ncbi:hypothetical protein NUW58_g9135 [Xylaria curta]|uniref:Uncharacterized protein n=1 Tax=Xylaria curta TaxID=42375 RepID=A0ACC1N2L0_9PEZI|nr:hypothetical protein NUW58_g9135 [Xylaria curta]
MTECLETVKTERDDLLAELNHWRSRAGMELRQANTMSQAPAHHGDASAASEVIIGAAPTALQRTDSSMNMIGEAAPPFITNSLHGPNPPPLPTNSNASMHWDGFEPQIHAFANHAQGENGPSNIVDADQVQLSTFQAPQSPNMPQFNVDRGHHGAVFLPFESPQSFNAGGFQVDTYMQNTVPLQDYTPP